MRFRQQATHGPFNHRASLSVPRTPQQHTAFSQESSNSAMTSSHSCKWARPQRLLSVTLALLVVVSLVVRSQSDLTSKERASAPVLLLDIVLPSMTAKHYVDTFWHDANFYKDFLKESGTVWLSLYTGRGSTSSSPSPLGSPPPAQDRSSLHTCVCRV